MRLMSSAGGQGTVTKSSESSYRSGSCSSASEMQRSTGGAASSAQRPRIALPASGDSKSTAGDRGPWPVSTVVSRFRPQQFDGPGVGGGGQRAGHNVPAVAQQQNPGRRRLKTRVRSHNEPEGQRRENR